MGHKHIEYRQLRLVIVANKVLPKSDARVQYAYQRRDVDFLFGFPQRPEWLARSAFLPVRFEEGLNARQILGVYDLWWRLREIDKGDTVVHLLSTVPLLFGSLVCRLRNTKYLMTITGMGRVFDQNLLHYRAFRWFYWWMIGKNIRAATAVLFQNRQHLELFRSVFPGEQKKLHYVGSAVCFPKRVPEYREAGQPLQVLMVSRLLPSKGIQDFLDVATSAKGDSIDFHLIGPPSPSGDFLRNKVAKLDQEKTIRYWGEIRDPEKLIARYHNSHIFLFPSYGEGMARVLLEAGFSGLCPVVYDIPANRDLIASDRGFLLPLHDKEGLLSTLRMLQQEETIRIANAKEFQRHVLSNFSLASFGTRMDAILNLIRSEHSKRGDSHCG